jgi:arginine decarboxylase
LTQSSSPNLASSPASWSIAQAADLYGIDRWGQGYFSINDQGRVVVHPTRDPAVSVDLMQLVEDLGHLDVGAPLLLRFTDILQHRINDLHRAFAKAIADNQYAGDYRAVYPIKVNQQRHVVEEIRDFGKQHGFGLEAGSKPELLAVMALVDDPNIPIICNGFKDDEFIEAVVLSTKMGKTVIPVVEKFSELKLIVKHAKQHDVRPTIGVRVKLAAAGAGRWESSGGQRSKFGLFVAEVVDAIEYLRDNGMLDCLQLLHCHIGSQVNSIHNVKSALIELSRVYVELVRAGAAMKYIDVGGGLGVDYDGSKTNFESSINYTLDEYASSVVFHIKDVCDDGEVPHPTIISESGRAIVAYHTVLVFNIVGWSGFDQFAPPAALTEQQREDFPKPLVNLFDAFDGVSASNFREYYHDAQLAHLESLHLFNLGYGDMQIRAMAERLYFGVCSKVLRIVRELDYVPEEFEDIERLLCNTYFCNYSIFQSMPDSWAIDQLFPIMPIHRLDEKPTCRGILADITCDSDGKIDRFIDLHDVKKVLELHPVNGEEYYLAAFLVGAYQETLGDLHNLFGDTNAVHISIDEQGRAAIDEIIQGDTVREVLGYVQYSPDELTRQIRKQVERALRSNRMSIAESRTLLKFYEWGMDGYTYLE